MRITAMGLPKKIVNNLWKILITLILVALTICMVTTYKIGLKIDRDIYVNGFTGVVIKKYRNRGDFVVYMDLKKKIQGEPIFATSELSNKVDINDTIIKLANSNICILKNKNKLTRVKCYRIDFSSVSNP